ncbi:MAG TPA: hypothetical protein VG891_12975 [Rhizomicrobium sp.]|nr:hypothetical protein [Rhizomicrobium sp.]
MDTLASWSEFVLFHVLPIAITQIVDWVREWQVLVAAIALIIFFHFWSRTILRAARQAAREVVLAETRSMEAGLKLLRRQIDKGAGPGGTATARTVRPDREPPGDPLPSAPIASRAAVERLRQSIRLALSTVPMSDEPLPSEGLRLYRAAIDALDGAGADLKDDRQQKLLNQILAELDALRRTFPPQSCRVAWQSLVKVNALAREFQEPRMAPAKAGIKAEAATS